MKIGKINFDSGTHIMGILNVTPDSFSDGGKFNNVEQAILHVGSMIKEGAEVIDVGGESTRPNYTQISDEEEIERVAPIIEKIKHEFDIPVSVDTYKSNVAKAAIDAGADLVNDIWGLKYDACMADVIKKSGVSCCIMHNRNNIMYRDFLQDVLNDLSKSIDIAKNAKINDNKILIDPGIGFSKTYQQNLYLTNHVEELKKLGYPVMLATSRKSMIGLTLDLQSQNRVEGTIATTVLAVMKKCLFVRVHDIKENSRAIKMTEAILNSTL